jgi:uncharacterized Zn ribbon protein
MDGKHCRACGAEVTEEMRYCPDCGTALKTVETAEERPRKDVKPKTKWIAFGLTIVVLAAGFSVYFGVLFREFHPVIAQQPSVVVPIEYGLTQKIPSQMITARMDRGFIVIPLQRILDLKLVRFYDPEGIQKIPLIAYITPEGKIVTAMSKSENCQSEDFYLEGHNIHCASCPSYWNMSSLEAYACCQRFYPDPIPSTLVGDEVRIDAQLVRQWHPRG